MAKRILYVCSRDPLETTFAKLHREAEANKCWEKQHMQQIYPHSMIFVGTHHKEVNKQYTTRIYVVWHLMPKSMKTLNKYICYLKQDFKIVVH
jgi:hypothetical protein